MWCTAAACMQSAVDVDGPAEWVRPWAFVRFAGRTVTDAKRTAAGGQRSPLRYGDDDDDYDAPAADAVDQPRRRSGGGPAPTRSCNCSFDYDWFPLSGYYPDELRVATCHGDQWCKPFVYPVKVLRNLRDKNRPSPVDTGVYTADDLPPELDDTDWRYATINLSIACFCPNDFTDLRN